LPLVAAVACSWCTPACKLTGLQCVVDVVVSRHESQEWEESQVVFLRSSFPVGDVTDGKPRGYHATLASAGAALHFQLGGVVGACTLKPASGFACHASNARAHLPNPLGHDEQAWQGALPSLAVRHRPHRPHGCGVDSTARLVLRHRVVSTRVAGVAAPLESRLGRVSGIWPSGNAGACSELLTLTALATLDLRVVRCRRRLEAAAQRFR